MNPSRDDSIVAQDLTLNSLSIEHCEVVAATDPISKVGNEVEDPNIAGSDDGKDRTAPPIRLRGNRPSFMSLPSELRCKIYTWLFSMYGPRDNGILRTSRLIYNEAMPTLLPYLRAMCVKMTLRRGYVGDASLRQYPHPVRLRSPFVVANMEHFRKVAITLEVATETDFHGTAGSYHEFHGATLLDSMPELRLLIFRNRYIDDGSADCSMRLMRKALEDPKKLQEFKLTAYGRGFRDGQKEAVKNIARVAGFWHLAGDRFDVLYLVRKLKFAEAKQVRR